MGRAIIVLALAAFTQVPAAAQGQTVKVIQNVNLRPDPSIEYAAIRLLKPTEPPLTLLESDPQFGYYHVKTQAGEEGYVWSHFVQVVAAPATTATAFHPDTGVAGSAEMVGCGDGLWQHVYHPSRLIVKQDCVTITGTIVDATAPHHNADGMRHEADGDTHGWLQVDSQFAAAINAGNTSDEQGNLVFELVCHYPVTQADAQPACSGFTDHTTIPPVGTHVAITGTFVQEKNHKKWNEIHPVSKIKIQ